MLNKIADTLETTTDFLINGNKDEKSKAALNDAELLQQFKEVDKMNSKDKNIIKELIDAFITKGKLKQLIV